jgi:hypothetical protein
LILEQDPDGDFFDCEEPDSDMYDNWHITRKNSQLHLSKGLQVRSKDEADGGGVQDYNKDESRMSYDTASTYISRHCGLEKTDERNKHQDSSIHWLPRVVKVKELCNCIIPGPCV